MRLVDSHCHLDDARFQDDLDEVIGRAIEAGVETMMTIGTGDGPPDLEVAIRLADRHDCLYASVGVHPHDAAKADEGTVRRLENLLRHPKVLALGEIGLDYHYDNSPRETQRLRFIEQLELASSVRTPIIIHTREAWPDTFSLLEQHWNPAAGGIMHCFSGGPAEVERSLAMGFHISFSGIVTYAKALEVQEAAKLVPSGRLLMETDAPYLAPIPHRGKRNEPAFVLETARKLALLRGQSLEQIVEFTADNWRALCKPGLHRAKPNR
ncbi:MAG: TatD family hydrolase [Acidobacteriia bacterium]|nr:TatD family hydrolase [Terriglobia bacterium]